MIVQLNKLVLFLAPVITAIKFLGLIVPVLLAVALLTLLERKVIGYTQFRKGPKLVGPYGVLQPIADGLKLFIKERIQPSSSKPLLFFVAPASFFLLAILSWGVIPLCEGSGLKLSMSLFFVLAISSLSSYSILIAGWASNSKYALLGALRGVAQAISYEVRFGLIIIPAVMLVGSWGLLPFNEAQQLIWHIFPCFPLFIMWFISTLAETNRAPFDLTEGESELVSGYKVEYSGGPFALFFIGEYAQIILICALTAVIWLGRHLPLGVRAIFGPITLRIKTSLLVFTFLWIRSSFPRIRYDQLMAVMWKGFLPLSVGALTLYFTGVYIIQAIPPYF